MSVLAEAVDKVEKDEGQVSVEGLVEHLKDLVFLKSPFGSFALGGFVFFYEIKDHVKGFEENEVHHMKNENSKPGCDISIDRVNYSPQVPNSCY